MCVYMCVLLMPRGARWEVRLEVAPGGVGEGEGKVRYFLISPF